MDAPKINAAGSEQQFTVATVLNHTFSTMLKGLPVFLCMSFIAVVPLAILGALLPEENIPLQALFRVAGTILSLVIQGAIAYAVYQILKGEKASMSDSFARGFGHILPLFFAALLTGIGIGLGMIALIIPGVILSCLWVATIPACVVERLGAIDSIKRSMELTKGYRVHIFLLFLIVGLVTVALSIVLGQVLVVLGISNLAVIGLIIGLAILLPSCFGSVMTATIYYDLRAVKEGMDIEKLTNVFA